MTEADLPRARRILRVAFGTFLGAPDPETFWTDLDYVGGRLGAEHTASFVAEEDGQVAGFNQVTRWGSVGFFGPLATWPDRQDRGVGASLVQAVSDQFDRWGVRHAGLVTFPQSPKHIGLYGKFGFRPRFLTPLMEAPAQRAGDAGAWSRYSVLSEDERRDVEGACRALTDMLFEGLDLGAEIRTVAARGLGDTLLLWDGPGRLAGFGVCHWGPASEAGAGTCFVKFAAARPGPGDAARFDALLDAWGSLATEAGMKVLLGGVNLAREEAHLRMLARGFRARANLVTLHRPNEAAYSRPGLYVLDDWR